MKFRQSVRLLLCFLAVGLPALALPPQATDEFDRNRQLLESWRSDPEHYTRLRRDLKAFWASAPEERERLRRLDHDLNETDPHTRQRYLGILDRYATWLERLTDADRQQIAVVDRTERLKVIRNILDRQYVDSLPQKLRDELNQLPAAERRTQIDQLHQDDKKLRLACFQLALYRPEVPARPPGPHPTRLEDFPADVRYYVENVLWRQIHADEAEQIKIADGAPWPLLARTILELAAKHPNKLPGPLNGPRRYLDLPGEDLKAMPVKELTVAQKKHLNECLGKWPDFAAEYALTARKNGISLPRQLGPCHPKQFDSRVAHFIERTLLPVLSDKEKDELKSAEGHWPEYPKTLLDLSNKHKLEVPLMHLPGPRELWDQARGS